MTTTTKAIAWIAYAVGASLIYGALGEHGYEIVADVFAIAAVLTMLAVISRN